MQMIKTPLFWCSLAWGAIIGTAGIFVILGAANIAAFFGAPVVLGLLISVSNGAGRPLVGLSFDRLGRSKTMYTCCILMLTAGIFLYSGALLYNTILIIFGLLLTGFSISFIPTVTVTNISIFFGQSNYPVNLSIHNFVSTPAALLGPILYAMILENSGGTYNAMFLLIIVFSLISFIVCVLFDLSAARMIRRHKLT